MSVMAAVQRAAGDDMVIQIATEAVGLFTMRRQIETVKAVRPDAVSIATNELIPDASAETTAAEIYAWAREHRIAVQQIGYSSKELSRLLDLIARRRPRRTALADISAGARRWAGIAGSVSRIMSFMPMVGVRTTMRNVSRRSRRFCPG